MRPTPPDVLSVTKVSSLTALAMWTLTNQTADEGADILKSRLTYSDNRSLARLSDLPGDSTSQLLEGLAPATNYSLQLTAVNVDGQASSLMKSFTTLVGQPLLNSVEVTRFNYTHVSILANVAYTGGGVIRAIEVRYSPLEYVKLQEVELLLELKWQALLILDGGKASRSDLQLTVSVHNQFDFQSNEMTVDGKLGELVTSCCGDIVC